MAVARYELWAINKEAALTEADKKQLKDFYLQNALAPKVRKALEEYLAEEEAQKQKAQPRATPSSPPRDRH